MLSIFQVTVSTCPPDRLTPVRGESENENLVIEQDEASGSQVATVLYALLLRVPATPVAFCHWLGPPWGPLVQDTSPAVHVVAPATGGVNAEALAISEIRSCLVADPRTMFCTATGTSDDEVVAAMFETENTIAAGTVTRACSTTVAVKFVV